MEYSHYWVLERGYSLLFWVCSLTLGKIVFNFNLALSIELNWLFSISWLEILVETFTSSTDPLQELRSEGEPYAKSVRERLDKMSPGLGNQVVSVKVSNNVKTKISKNVN